MTNVEHHLDPEKSTENMTCTIRSGGLGEKLFISAVFIDNNTSILAWVKIYSLNDNQAIVSLSQE